MAEDVSPALKDMFDAARFRQIAELLSGAHQGFDRNRFLTIATAGLGELSLIQRVRRMTEACHATLPEKYPGAVAVLKKIAPKVPGGFVGIFLPDFIGQHGHSHFEESMDALKFFTPFSSAEFAIREFLKRDLPRTLAVMEQWSLDPDEHVRRLASEGSRPRLPWSFRLEAISRDPSLAAKILHNLKADPSLYVRKSVANHLNDISKDHPEIMLDRLEGWDLKNPHTAWIARHASRSLIKAGHARTLRLFGFNHGANVKLSRFILTPVKVKLGDTLAFSFILTSVSKKSQNLAVDYAVHYRKKSGKLAPKVFKLKELTLRAGKAVSLGKRQRFINFTTRVHYRGSHTIELLVNGQSLGRKTFELIA